jgi:hypothetical protein
MSKPHDELLLATGIPETLAASNLYHLTVGE